MGLKVVLKTETGTELKSLPRYFGELITFSERIDFPLLGHIDPYGDTIFNRLQMESISLELKQLLDAGPDSDEKRSFIESLIAICAEGLRRPHRYLWFSGD